MFLLWTLRLRRKVQASGGLGRSFLFWSFDGFPGGDILLVRKPFISLVGNYQTQNSYMGHNLSQLGTGCCVVFCGGGFY